MSGSGAVVVSAGDRGAALDFAWQQNIQSPPPGIIVEPILNLAVGIARDLEINLILLALLPRLRLPSTSAEHVPSGLAARRWQSRQNRDSADPHGASNLSSSSSGIMLAGGVGHARENEQVAECAPSRGTATDRPSPFWRRLSGTMRTWPAWLVHGACLRWTALSPAELRVRAAGVVTFLTCRWTQGSKMDRLGEFVSREQPKVSVGTGLCLGGTLWLLERGWCWSAAPSKRLAIIDPLEGIVQQIIEWEIRSCVGIS
jgi:hypothetical protein